MLINFMISYFSIDTYDSGIASTTTVTTAATGRGLKKGVISSDGIIDDDFESELGGQNSTVQMKLYFNRT